MGLTSLAIDLRADCLEPNIAASQSPRKFASHTDLSRWAERDLRHNRQVHRAGRSSLPWLLAVVLGAAAGCDRGRHPPAPPLVAQVEGTLQVSGLTAPVRIVRDTWGVPHIRAENQDDLFFAQGFVQAQDRLFQMDLWRRSVQGRLSEVLGPNFVERDAMTRRIQYRGDLAAEWDSYGAGTKAIATAFVRAVNAWAARARERPPEEFVLAGYKPETWAAEDLLNRTDAFVASGDALDEIFRARLAAVLGAAELDALLPSARRTAVPPGLDLAAVSPVVADAIRRVGTPPFFVGLAGPVAGGPLRAPDVRSTPTVDRPVREAASTAFA